MILWVIIGDVAFPWLLVGHYAGKLEPAADQYSDAPCMHALDASGSLHALLIDGS